MEIHNWSAKDASEHVAQIVEIERQPQDPVDG
jgi:hypothetical protein